MSHKVNPPTGNRAIIDRSSCCETGFNDLDAISAWSTARQWRGGSVCAFFEFALYENDSILVFIEFGLLHYRTAVSS
jgi:hypothetical protein